MSHTRLGSSEAGTVAVPAQGLSVSTQADCTTDGTRRPLRRPRPRLPSRELVGDPQEEVDDAALIHANEMLRKQGGLLVVRELR